MAIITSDHASEKLLSLSNPNNFGVSLQEYTRSHEQLKLKIHRMEESQADFHLIFVLVKYIDLPYGCQVTQIDTAPEEECGELIARVFNINAKQSNANEFKWDLLDRLRLYVFKTQRWQYRVLAFHTIQTEHN